MKSKNLLFASIILLSISCRDNKGRSATTEVPDSLAVNANFTDTLNEHSDDILKLADSNDYKTETQIDTLFAVNDDQINVSLRNQFDSSKLIIVPKKYVGVYGIDSFCVFEAFSRLTIKKNGRFIVDTIITKSTFTTVLDTSLGLYGNLMFPNIDLKNNSIQIDHSLSIPMTDVGIAVSSTFVLD